MNEMDSQLKAYIYIDKGTFYTDKPEKNGPFSS